MHPLRFAADRGAAGVCSARSRAVERMGNAASGVSFQPDMLFCRVQKGRQIRLPAQQLLAAHRQSTGR
jgi:hypothetical protein